MHGKFLSDISELFSDLPQKLLPWVIRERQARELALEVHQRVCQLSGLPPTRPDRAFDDSILVLNSTCLLLDRLVRRSHPFPAPAQNRTVVEDEEIKVTYNLPPVEEKSVIAKIFPLPATSSETSTAPHPILEIDPEPKVSATAQELIKLRDWVLMAKTADSAPSAAVLESLYQQLGQILAKAGVTTLEEMGVFNYERQQVISTQKTDDPDRNERVFDTVRPGYLFQGKLVRPQEVIIYIFEGFASAAEDTVS